MQTWRDRHVTVAQLAVTGTSPKTTWVTAGYTGVNIGSTVLHSNCSMVNRESTGILVSWGPGLYRGNVGNIRTQFIFYEMCPGASRYTGCSASGCTVATSAQWERGFPVYYGMPRFNTRMRQLNTEQHMSRRMHCGWRTICYGAS